MFVEINDQIRRNLWVDAYQISFKSGGGAPAAVCAANTALKGYDDAFNGKAKAKSPTLEFDGAPLLVGYYAKFTNSHDDLYLSIAHWFVNNQIQTLHPNRLAQTLNENGIKTKKGKLWTGRNVSRYISEKIGRIINLGY